MKIVILLLFIFLTPVEGKAYTFNYVDEDRKVFWTDASQTIYFNPENTNGILDSELRAILDKVAFQWNQSNPRVHLNFVESIEKPSKGRNNLYFDKDSIYLGPNVVGVTVTTHEQGSGRLIEANVILNDNLSLSSSSEESNFLGDVITHEIGHFLGLGHSQLHNSTMFYLLRRGQSRLHADDNAGLKALYPYSDNKIGSISGEIAGGGEVGVFGAHVTAISSTTGKSIAAAVSDDKGHFKIEGLPINDQYFLYIDKLKGTSNYSSFYKEAKSDFCKSGFAYRGSFFQSCLSEDEGYPQGINLTSTSRDRYVGVVSVRCRLDVPPKYLEAKGGGEFKIEPLYFPLAPPSFGEAFVGFYTGAEAKQNRPDRILLDYSNVDLETLYGNKQLYLRLNIQIDELYSPLQVQAEATTFSGAIIRSHQGGEDEILLNGDLNPTTSFSMLIPLDTFNKAHNIVELELTPRMLEEVASENNISLDKILPGVQDYGDDLLFYLLEVSIVERVSSTKLAVVGRKRFSPLRDNSACLDAYKTYNVKSPDFFPTDNIERGVRRKSGARDGLLGACGIVHLVGPDSNDPGGGPGAAGCLLLAMLLYLTLHWRKKELVS
jgi:hypothetical protein